MIHLDFDDTVPLGLHGYVRLVCRALGLRGECSYVQVDAPVSAYIALDERLAGFPDHDVALLWDEHHGWSAAIENHHGGEELPVVACLGQDLLPRPEVVAAWARSLSLEADHVVPEDERPVFDASGLRQRLSGYIAEAFAQTAQPVHAAPVRGSDDETLAIA